MAVVEWDRARAQARADRLRLPETADLDSLLTQALAAEGVQVRPRPPRDSLLAGAHAVLDPEAETIWIRADAAPGERRLILAHELGHCRLHHAPEDCRCDEGDLDDTPESVSLHGYGPRQRRETEANVYAREFLLPGPLAQERFAAGESAHTIATELGLPLPAVFAQLTVGTQPLRTESTATEGVVTAGLDPSQEAAARAEYGPLLVGAGPGTGKTRTLTARVLFLVQEKGLRPENILALTFSRKAAEEMRERIGLASPEIAARAAITTFHAYGLDLLRRHYTAAGLPPRPILLTEAEAFALLEKRIASLELGALQYLHDPAYPLPEALRAIARAKEAGTTPELLAARAEAAADDKWRDIAQLFALYQNLLQEKGALDFADLIVRPLALLEARSELLQAERTRWHQVLVDEYQDVNRAGARLVQLLTGPDGGTLWAVGDLRQAIYAFRGASPANVARFAEDFPGGRRADLAVNYRSRPGLVELFGVASGEGEQVWEPRREGPATTTLAVAQDDVAQAEGIAAAMSAFVAEGYTWRDIALLCRTRSQARALRNALLARQIPMGPGPDEGGLLSRPDCRRLLTLLEATCHPEGAASQLLGALPDGLVVTPVTDPAELWNEVLWGKPGWGRQLTEPEAVGALLSLAQSFRERATVIVEEGTDLKRAFLEHLRRLARLGATPAAPSRSADQDTVTVLTIHGSKGLEFPVVFVPNLAAGKFPPRPAPSLLAPLPDEDAEPEVALTAGPSDEEARLFFVALTRARDHLVLSRAARYGRMGARPSPLLEAVQALPQVSKVFWERGDAPELVAEAPAEPAYQPLADDTTSETLIKAADAEVYLRCPRRYEFQLVRELSPGAPTAYLAFKRVVQAALSAEKPIEALERLWRELGPPPQDPMNGFYRKIAEQVVARNAAFPRAEQRPALAVPLDGGSVIVRPDELSTDGDWERRTLRKPPAPDAVEAPLDDQRLALLQEAAGPEKVFVRYLQDGRRLPVADRPKQREKYLADYERALRGIALRLFPPTPAEPGECPTCPYFFVCPQNGSDGVE